MKIRVRVMMCFPHPAGGSILSPHWLTIHQHKKKHYLCSSLVCRCFWFMMWVNVFNLRGGVTHLTSYQSVLECRTERPQRTGKGWGEFVDMMLKLWAAQPDGCDRQRADAETFLVLREHKAPSERASQVWTCWGASGFPRRRVLSPLSLPVPLVQDEGAALPLAHLAGVLRWVTCDLWPLTHVSWSSRELQLWIFSDLGTDLILLL